jgi:hypothetical protein
MTLTARKQWTGEPYKRGVDEQMLIALDRRRDGANSHDIGVARSIYISKCQEGHEEHAGAYERAFNALLSGRMGLREAIAEYRYANKRSPKEVL